MLSNTKTPKYYGEFREKVINGEMEGLKTYDGKFTIGGRFFCSKSRLLLLKADGYDKIMIRFRNKGNFKNTERLLKKSLGNDYRNILDRYGQEGVSALASYTPVESGETASSWSYKIIQNNSYLSVVWENSHVNKGVNIAIILQYGHGTGTGGYVVGRDYINPALRPIFDKMADAAWHEIIT